LAGEVVSDVRLSPAITPSCWLNAPGRWWRLRKTREQSLWTSQVATSSKSEIKDWTGRSYQVFLEAGS